MNYQHPIVGCNKKIPFHRYSGYFCFANSIQTLHQPSSKKTCRQKKHILDPSKLTSWTGKLMLGRQAFPVSDYGFQTGAMFAICSSVGNKTGPTRTFPGIWPHSSWATWSLEQAEVVPPEWCRLLLKAFFIDIEHGHCLGHCRDGSTPKAKSCCHRLQDKRNSSFCPSISCDHTVLTFWTNQCPIWYCMIQDHPVGRHSVIPACTLQWMRWAFPRSMPEPVTMCIHGAQIAPPTLLPPRFSFKPESKTCQQKKTYSGSLQIDILDRKIDAWKTSLSSFRLWRPNRFSMLC